MLLLRREIFILWDLPGGGINPGEEPAHAAVRECREETGYIIELDGAIGKYLHQSVYGLGDQLTYAFRGHIVGGKPKRFGLEITELRWCDVNNLPRGLETLHRQIISDARANTAEIVERRIDFRLWKLYPARIIFFIMRVVNDTIRRFL